MKNLMVIGIVSVGSIVFGEPLLFDNEGVAIQSRARTICGSDDLVAVENQDDVIRQLARPVGLLQGPGFRCTGTLVSSDLFLTARHCYAECSGLSVTFNYLNRDSEVFKCQEIVEKGAGEYNQDYMLFRLEGRPGVEWGWYDLSDRELKAKDTLLMIHHPGGNLMKASIKNCAFQKERAGLLYHSCDTTPGSSGGAVVAPDFQFPEKSRVVGVHAFAGCNSAETSFNSGPAIRYISTFSKAIRDLVK